MISAATLFRPRTMRSASSRVVSGVKLMEPLAMGRPMNGAAIQRVSLPNWHWKAMCRLGLLRVMFSSIH